MEQNIYTEFLNSCRNNAKISNTALGDDEMKKAQGGFGGANETTCPKCGKPMKKVNNPYGDDSWHCDDCDIDQICTDAEYIEILKAAEAAGQTQGLVYPVWWKKKKNS